MSEQTKAERKAELEALDKAYQKKLDAMMKETIAVIHALNANPDGFARLADITDEEWQAAVDADEEAAGA